MGLWLLYRPAGAFAAVHERLASLPYGWTEKSAPSTEKRITLQVGLSQQNMDQLISQLYAVSTPGGASYGQHLDRDDVKAMIQPSDEADQAVQSWLKSEGAEAVYSDGSWVSFVTTVGNANKMLNASFMHYEYEGSTKLRTTEYSVPDSLSEHIDLIWPTTFFGKTVASAPLKALKASEISSRAADLDSSCSKTITPTCLKELYNSTDYTPDASSGSVVAFGSFLNQSARYKDLELYETKFGITSLNFTTELINGATNDQARDDNHDEANLDVQNIIGVSNPLPVTQFITGGSPPFVPNLDEPTDADNENEPYLPYYQYLLDKTNDELPQVISNSYGDDEQTVPIKYAKRVCNMIAELGVRGITVLESSGDTGVGGPCLSNDGTDQPQFTPAFPGTCPYITAVGGTQSVSPEVAWTDSTGGFSNYFERPSYQDDKVQEYLDNYISAETLAYYEPYTNTSMRGFPDVSAHSLSPYYYVYTNNAASLSGGTSAASPVFAAIVGMLNDARLRDGKTALGFLNPWLYSDGFNYLNDITGGGSVGCNGENGQTGASYDGSGIIPWASWNATVGWDPVTGLGTPDFGKLKDAVLALDTLPTTKA
ncbi:subtilisin-like protein [Saccharata proteae CBS 121410]|uniref:tripeptidyl-peptidase II n=1 Tax=Saccharata proteae CBS 121410 TaxID=1314787 RepID=A0A9P4LYJ6_9PEZI|nr:subtilisin-like protein [Saccharata proteae CBS 121410]